MQTPPPLTGAPPPPPNWINRNWKWFVPLSCLLFVVCIGVFFVLILSFMKSSDAYSDAVALARSNPSVIAVLGTPIKDGFFFTGNISENNSSGTANLVVPISGPRGKATLYVSASKSFNQWHFDNLVVQIADTNQRIDVLNTNQVLPAIPPSDVHSGGKQ